MQTRALRTLLSIAQSQSFAKAAEARGMTLSAVSMQMKALEQQLDLTLFDRTYRPPRLTPVARQILAHARAVVSAEDAFLSSIRPHDALAGDFRIGFINTASVRVLPGFLRRARTALPNAQFTLQTGLSHELEAEIRAGHLDFGIITGPAEETHELYCDTLASEALQFACNADEPSRNPAEIAQRTTFLQFRPAAGIGKLIARQVAPFLAARAPRPIVLDSVDAILECVKEGVGFTLLPAPDIRRTADQRVAAFWEDGVPQPRRDLCLICRPEQRQVADAIAALLRDALGDPPSGLTDA